MPDHKIRVTTEADLTGFHPLEEALRRYKELSEAISANFAKWTPPEPPPSPGGPAASQAMPRAVGDPGTDWMSRPFGEVRQQAAQIGQSMPDLIPHLDRLADALEKVSQSHGRAAATGGGSTGYNLNTIPGLENWVQNVMEPAQPVIDAMEAAGQGPLPPSTAPSQQTRRPPSAPIASPSMTAAVGRVNQAYQAASQGPEAALFTPPGAAVEPTPGFWASARQQAQTAWDAATQWARPPKAVGATGPSPMTAAGSGLSGMPLSHAQYQAVAEYANALGRFQTSTNPAATEMEGLALDQALAQAQKASGLDEATISTLSDLLQQRKANPALTPIEQSPAATEHWLRSTVKSSGGLGLTGGGAGGGSGGAPPPATGGAASPLGGWSAGMEGALGGLASKYLPFLTGAGALMFGAAQIEQGWGEWQTTGTPFSSLSKVTGTAGEALVAFRDQVLSAGTAVGYSIGNLTSVAGQLSTVLGTMSSGQLAASVGNVASFARGTGLTLEQSAQMFSAAGQAGLISGAGAPYTQFGFAALLGSMAAQGDMIARMGPMATGYLSAMQNVESNNIVPVGAQGVADILTTMSSTDIQGMQGMRGANLFNALNSGYVGNQGGFGQSLIFSALERANPALASNPMGMLSIQAAGLGAPVYGTHELALTAMQRYVSTQLGGAHPAYANAAQNFFPINQSAQYETALLMKLFGLGPSQVNVANAWGSLMGSHSHLVDANSALHLIGQAGASPSDFTTGAVQYLGELGAVHTQTQFSQLLDRFIQNGGLSQLSSHQRSILSAAIKSGHLPAETQALAMSMQHWTPMNIMDWQQAQAAGLALTRSRMASWITPVVGGMEGVIRHNPVTFGLSTVGAAGLTWWGGKYAARTMRGLMTRLRGGSTAEVQAADQAAQAAGEPVIQAGANAAADTFQLGAGTPSSLADMFGPTGAAVGESVAGTTRASGSLLDALGAFKGMGAVAPWMPVVGSVVSMATDIPHMLAQIHHGQAGRGIGGLIGTGGGAWGGMAAGATIAAPLDPFTFGLASVVGAGAGALGGSTLGQHIGSWLGGILTGEHPTKQMGSVAYQSMTIGELWIQNMMSAGGSSGRVSLPTGHAAVSTNASGSPPAFGFGSFFNWMGHPFPSFNTANGSSVMHAVSGPALPPIPLIPNATFPSRVLQWTPQIAADIAHMAHHSPLLTPALVESVMWHESRGYQAINGHINSSGKHGAGALGLMQLEPGTAHAMGVNPYNAAQNVQGGIAYLDKMLNQFGSAPLALAAYARGAGAVQAAGDHIPNVKLTGHETLAQYIANEVAMMKENVSAIKELTAELRRQGARSLQVGVGPTPNKTHLLPKRSG